MSLSIQNLFYHLFFNACLEEVKLETNARCLKSNNIEHKYFWENQRIKYHMEIKA